MLRPTSGNKNAFKQSTETERNQRYEEHHYAMVGSGITHNLCLLHAGRSHCLVEWDGNPLIVVLYSAVSCREGENDVQVGDECCDC